MMYVKKSLYVILTGTMILVACASPAAAPAQSAAVQPTAPAVKICTVHNNADHPSITAVVQGMDEEAKVYNAELTYFDPAFDPQKQATMIEDCISRKPDVIVVNAVDPAAVISSIKKAFDAGIPVINQNAKVAPEGMQYIRQFIGYESTIQGYAVGKMMVGKLGDKNANVIFIIGKPGQSDSDNRVIGAKKAWADAGKTYNVIAEQPAEWNKDKALAVMQDLLTRFPSPGIDAVFAMDDPMAIGALTAIKAAGRVKEIAVFGVNGNTDACNAIKAGEMFGTAMQMSYLVGVYTVRTAYDIKIGRLVADQILAPSAPITPENVDSWMKKCW